MAGLRQQQDKNNSKFADAMELLAPKVNMTEGRGKGKPKMDGKGTGKKNKGATSAFVKDAAGINTVDYLPAHIRARRAQDSK